MRSPSKTKTHFKVKFFGAASFTTVLLLAAVTVGCKQDTVSATAAETAIAAAPAVPQAASAPAHTYTKRQIYSITADTKKEIAAAIVNARKEHKKIILDFGGNWCGDCQVLDIYFHQSPNAELLAKYFVLVDVDIEQYDHNLDIAQKYGIPLKKGVPALAVLDSSGKLLYSQADKEFEHMASMESQSVTDFLNHWKS